MTHVLCTSFTLPLAIDEVFAFFAEAGSLERIFRFRAKAIRAILIRGRKGDVR